LPEIPDGDKKLSFGFEMGFELLENEELGFFVGEVVHNGDTINVVKFAQVFPDIRLGNIGFDKVMMREFFTCFFQEFGAYIQAGVLDIFGEAEKKAAIATADINNRRTWLDIGKKRLEIRPDVVAGSGEITAYVVVDILYQFDFFG